MLHPQARALLNLIEERKIPPTHTLSPEQSRQLYLERRFFTQPVPPAVALVRDLSMPGPAGPIPLRLYRPIGSPVATWCSCDTAVTTRSIRNMCITNPNSTVQLRDVRNGRKRTYLCRQTRQSYQERR